LRTLKQIVQCDEQLSILQPAVEDKKLVKKQGDQDLILGETKGHFGVGRKAYFCVPSNHRLVQMDRGGGVTGGLEKFACVVEFEKGTPC